jgi:hypothetical protein
MELKRILVGVAPNGPGIRMACILSEIIQANPIPAQQGQAGTSPAMSRNSSLGVLDIHSCPRTQHWNQRLTCRWRMMSCWRKSAFSAMS